MRSSLTECVLANDAACAWLVLCSSLQVGVALMIVRSAGLTGHYGSWVSRVANPSRHMCCAHCAEL